jgi:hypothetical protein
MLKGQANESPIVSAAFPSARCEVELSACEDCIEKLTPSNPKRWKIKVDLMPDDDDTKDDTWLKVGMRGVGHWHLSDSSLKKLGVSFIVDVA